MNEIQTALLMLAGFSLPFAYNAFQTWRDRQTCQLAITDSVGSKTITTTYTGPASGMEAAARLHEAAVDEAEKRTEPKP